ncbi:hypothetical protein [Bradyrhizobium sp. SUTN9-2]|uniref:hypothetical protein n=1 Tax=Bradyrhizobium sp. SUTN9-2 TaxID=1167456 RepID=UPI0011B1F334|nr:hypothetical protein [Bradyrhizobium sp. SUTN9-2]
MRWFEIEGTAMNQRLGKRKRKLQQQATPVHRGVPKARRYFHGGRAGYKEILPPSLTGAEQNGVVPDNVRRKDRVYVTTDIAAAIVWAAQHSSPMLYEVEPKGAIEADPDHKGVDTSFQCEKAEIVALHAIPEETLQQARSALLK